MDIYLTGIFNLIAEDLLLIIDVYTLLWKLNNNNSLPEIRKVFNVSFNIYNFKYII